MSRIQELREQLSSAKSHKELAAVVHGVLNHLEGGKKLEAPAAPRARFIRSPKIRPLKKEKNQKRKSK